MKRLAAFCVGLLACLALLVTWVSAQEKKGTNVGEGAKGAPAPVAVQDTAMETAAWARASKNAAGLAVASCMLASVPTRDMGKVDKATEQKEKGKESPAKEQKEVTPESLMAEAKAMAGDDKAMLAAVEAIQKSAPVARGAVPGAIIHWDTVNAYTTDIYTITFRGGEFAEIGIRGDGYPDLDLYVYDENGNLIGSDTDSTDQCYVSWTPIWTGPFQVKVRNLGPVWNHYVLLTN
jgi:hypothetical protein